MLLLVLSDSSSTWLICQKLVGLVGSHEEIVSVSDKLKAVDNALIVKKHTSDLASEVTIALLDDREDSISNLLFPLVWILDLVENSLNINKWLHLHLLHLILVHHCFLLHHHVTLLLLLLLQSYLLLLPSLLHGCLRLLLHDCILLHVDILNISWHIWHHLVVVIVWHWSLVTWAALLMEFTALRRSTTLSLLASSLHLIVPSNSLALLSSVHWASIHTLHSLVEHVLEEVSLDLLEASILTLLMELTAWHPVLDRECSGSEGS